MYVSRGRIAQRILWGLIMAHEFVIMRNGILETYTDYDKIPTDFQHVIKFNPEMPPGPHTEEEHDEMGTWNDKLQRLMHIERTNGHN